MKIGIDVDDVLAAFMDSFIKFYNTEYKTNYRLEDFFSFAFWDVIGGTPKDTYRVVDKFNKSEYFDAMIPIKHAQTIVRQLKENMI